MSIKLFSLLFLCGACIAAPVQTKEAHSTTQVASQAASFTSLPVVGNVVIVGISTGSSANATGATVADNQSNNYVRVGALPYAGQIQVSLWCAPVVTSSGTFTITATTQGVNNFVTILAAEYAGYSCETEKSATATGATSPYSCGSFTTINAADLLVTVLDNNASSGTSTFTAPSGYTLQLSQTSTSFQPGGFADRVVSTTLTTTPTWTNTQNATSFCVLAAFMALRPTAGAFP